MDKVLLPLLGSGAVREAFVDFSTKPTPRHLKYMTLVAGEGGAADGQDSALPDGVLEAGGRAVVYIVQHAALAYSELHADDPLSRLVRTLACRADAPFLAVVEPGVTTVYRIGFYQATDSPQLVVKFNHPDDGALRDLLNGTTPTDQSPADVKWLDDLLFKLLTSAAKDLREACPRSRLDDGQILSMIGRALFTRFIVDRNIATAKDIKSIAPGVGKAEHLFATIESTAATFEWLDATFNGNLLDLNSRDYAALLRSLGPARKVVCEILSRIMWRTPDAQLNLDWGGLHFKHIPVDVLSQVYEHFAHRYTPASAKQTSIHFTPRAIAEIAVDGAFGALEPGRRSTARVLDPAVGAGVFLVLAFRRLVAEEWLLTSERPERKRIRQIMRQQLCGLDINPQSIKIAALSIYLAALELDPQPQPLSELRFERLFDQTLRCVSDKDLEPSTDRHLGSLSVEVSTLGQSDIVICNPPWTALSKKHKSLLDDIPRQHGLGGADLVPNQWPDLAFMWRSLGWSRPGGVIALLVNGRLLFSQEALAARRQWFGRTRVTGVLNGATLRTEKKIWATNSQPFCAMVCINQEPAVGDSFYFLTPRNEPALVGRREFRLDPHSAQPVPNDLVLSNRFVLKTLSKGSALDVNLVERIRASSDSTLNDLAQMRQGFIAGEQNLQEAKGLANLPALTGNYDFEYDVEVAWLPKFKSLYPKMKLQWPRDPEIYRGPVLLFREAPKQGVSRRGALWVDENIAFSRSFYGIPASGGNLELAQYLYLLSYSDLLAYWVLMTSAKFGVERDTYYMEDYKNFPVVPPGELEQHLRKRISSLVNIVRAGDQPWEKLNEWVAQIYGLNRYDIDLIADAVTYESPYADSRDRSLGHVSARSACVASFTQTLSEVFGVSGHSHVQVRVCEEIVHPVWQFVHIEVESQPSSLDDTAVTLAIAATSEQLMSSELRIELPRGGWLVGRLRQERYWTRSKARLLALDLLERGLIQAHRRAA